MIKCFVAVAAALFISATPAAASVTISFSGAGIASGASAGNVVSFSNNGIGVQASAWSYSGTTLQTAVLGGDPNGLGVTNNVEASWGLTGSPLVDNLTQSDLILLVFNQAVNIQSAVLSPLRLGNFQSANDARVAYVSLSGAYTSPTPTPMALGSNIWATLSSGEYNVSGATSSPYLTSLGSAGYGNVWLIAAAKGNYYDGFQLSSINVTTPVPEPSTWAMLVVGFCLIGAVLRQRKTAPRVLMQIA